MKIVALSRKGALASFAVAALAAASLTGCGSEKTDPSKDTRPGTQTAAANNPSPAATNAAPMANTGTPAATTIAPAAPAATGPNGRSAVPSVAEWAAETKEVGVKGSTKLNCETKMVREWLRISCRGKNDTGGEPRSVTIKKGGGRGDTFTFASGGVASLVMPFVDGTDLLADFEWSDKKLELAVSWPHGAPMPPLKGEFR